MGILGSFTFVLHSHLPYARLAGRWPHGEEWIHEAASETYIPLLQTLYDLKEDGIEFKLTIGISPVLAEQLTDSLVLDHLNQYLDARIAAAEYDMGYFAPQTGDGQENPTADPHLNYLSSWYRDGYLSVKTAFNTRFQQDIIGAFRSLQDEGYIELISSAATHGYLPLLGRDSSIRGQIKTGIDIYERLFGQSPTTFWLPECAYRPAYIADDSTVRPGLESFLAEFNLKTFLSETHAVTGGQPVGVAAGNVIGPYGDIKRHYVLPPGLFIENRKGVTTYQPYYVADSSKDTTPDQHSGVIVIGRNDRTGQQVWSADWGYPGDFDYLEFHKKAGTSGLRYWRVTGAKTDLAHKDYYHPEWASFKIDQHAEHFAHLVGDLLRDYHREHGTIGLIASNYDTELFGHWWFEGVQWLGKVLRHLASNPEIQLTTITRFVEENPPEQALNLPESSWGAGGQHFSWNNGETSWMWPPIHEAEKRLEDIANTHQSPSEGLRLVLNQAARELLLLQSSDWPFLITTGQAKEYAIQRFSQHLERFNKLMDSVENDRPDTVYAKELFEIDKVFPDIDYRWFSQG